MNVEEIWWSGVFSVCVCVCACSVFSLVLSLRATLDRFGPTFSKKQKCAPPSEKHLLLLQNMRVSRKICFFSVFSSVFHVCLPTVRPQRPSALGTSLAGLFGQLACAPPCPPERLSLAWRTFNCQPPHPSTKPSNIASHPSCRCRAAGRRTDKRADWICVLEYGGTKRLHREGCSKN